MNDFLILANNEADMYLKSILIIELNHNVHAISCHTRSILEFVMDIFKT